MPASGRGSAAAEWVSLGQLPAPQTGAPAVAFTTPGGDDPGTAVGNLLGVCGEGGIVDHYRGDIFAANGTAGENRTINSVLIESYLRGVVPRESPASWGAAGGGAGANALRAQSVAARSYALTQGSILVREHVRQLGLPGLRRRRLAGLGDVEHGDVERARTDRRRDRGDGRQGPPWPSTGLIVSTEFSASNGPRTAGGSFPAVDDPADAEPANPLHRWTRVIDANAFATKFGLGTLTAAWAERDPATVVGRQLG